MEHLIKEDLHTMRLSYKVSFSLLVALEKPNLKPKSVLTLMVKWIVRKLDLILGVLHTGLNCILYQMIIVRQKTTGLTDPI